MTPLSPRLIFVGGCPRSGTSLVASMLNHLGLDTVTDTRRTVQYPTGYHEHVPLLMFHKAMERYPRGHEHYRAESAISREPFLKPAYLEDEFVATMFRQAFAPAVKREVDFLKFPQLALSPGFLLSEFPDAVLLFLWRDPVATFRSLVTKEFPVDRLPASAIRAVLLWGMYAFHICKVARRVPERVTVLNVDELVQYQTAPLPELLELWGYEPSSLSGLESFFRPEVWTFNPGPSWRLGLRVAQSAARAVVSKRGPELNALVEVWAWEERLEELSCHG